MGITQLGQPVHHLGSSESFRQEQSIRRDFLHLGDQPFPHRKRLGMRIIYPENAYSLRNPEFKDAFDFIPQRPPVVGLKVEGIDVLILFRRILGILHRAIGTPAEPVGVLPDVGMIRRTLQSDI